jgi:hypothetical protein
LTCCLLYTALGQQAKVAHSKKEESAKERLTPPLDSAKLSPTATTTNKKGERIERIGRKERKRRERLFQPILKQKRGALGSN